MSKRLCFLFFVIALPMHSVAEEPDAEYEQRVAEYLEQVAEAERQIEIER